MARELRRDQLGTHLRAMTAYGEVVRLVTGPPGRRARFHLVTRRHRAGATHHRRHPAPRRPGLVPGRRQAAAGYGAGGGPTISKPYLR
jgi:hypothetical protein